MISNNQIPARGSGTLCGTCTRIPSSVVEKWKASVRKGVSRATYRFIPFKEYHTTPFVPCCQIVTRVIELDRRDDISYVDDVNLRKAFNGLRAHLR